MKRILYTISLILVLSLSSMVALAKDSNLDVNIIPVEGITSEIRVQSVEKVYEDMIMSLLTPHIVREVQGYYGKDAEVDLPGIKVLEVKRSSEYSGFKFKVKIQVEPFVGAHNSIGIDNLIFTIQPTGVRLEKFNHIKSLMEIPQI